MNYNNKKFKALHNSENGEISNDTIFVYKQVGHILTCEYTVGNIVKGQLIGIVDDAGNIDMRYQQVNSKGEIRTGVCQSSPEINDQGKIILTEKWQWTSGDLSSGSSLLMEV